MLQRHLYYTLLFLMFATTFQATPALAEGRGFYPDGQLKWEYLFQNGEISEAKWYSATGQLVSRQNYVAGQPEQAEGYRTDGSVAWQSKPLAEGRHEITRFNEAGQMVARYQVVDDQPDGEYTTFTAEGQPKQTVTYQRGILDGPAKTFYGSGQLEHEFTYRDNQVDGPYRTYSSEGVLLSEYTFSSGKLQ